MLTEYFQEPAVDYQHMLEETLVMAEIIKPMLTDVSEKLYAHESAGHRVLFEGAQGALLDIDFPISYSNKIENYDKYC